MIPRLRRLAEELDELRTREPVAGSMTGAASHDELRRLTADETFLEEVDRALRPVVHERRIASSGTILDPRSDPRTWETGTELEIAHTTIGLSSADDARRFADGLSSWFLRRHDQADELLMFDRPAGSERDLVVMARVFATTIVQRHPSGVVRVAGDLGVLRWDGVGWHHEPPLATWIDSVATGADDGSSEVLTALLEFAVHDLGASGVGALLIHRPADVEGPLLERRVAPPPPLRADAPFHLAPLRHALAQVDGATVFDAHGLLCCLGVRLVPSLTAERDIDGFGGTRHTSGRRYSYDDPAATVIAVSEDGPVTVFRNGEVLGRSPDG